MVRDFGAKLRITAALLGCASQKDLCARFREVNPGTTFELDRSYKWMQGRALPRSVRLYDDWAALLGTGRPAAWLQSCTVEQFLELVCGHFDVSREALVGQAGFGAGPHPDGAEPEQPDALPSSHLAGAYACYCHSWSPYFEGKLVRGSLVVEAVGGGAPALAATYSETVAVGRARLRGPVAVLEGAVHIDVSDDAAQFRLAMCLFLPGMLAGALAGVICGVALVDVVPQPAATRVVMIRVPGAAAQFLDASNGYLDPAKTPLSSDLMALGLRVAAPAELDTLLEGFLAADRPSSHLKVTADDYSRLTLAIDRLFIDNDVISGSEIRLPGVAADFRGARAQQGIRGGPPWSGTSARS